MTHETLQREIHVDASPDVVFDVVSDPRHVEQWWPDRAAYDLRPGGPGHIEFGDCNDGGKRVAFTVVDARPPRLFSFRWTHELGGTATAENSLLVTFELEEVAGGTLLRMTESGFTGRGLDDAAVVAEYEDHESGWDHFLGRLPGYAVQVAAS